MSNAQSICVSNAETHRSSIDGGSRGDTPECGLTSRCRFMLTTCADGRDTPVRQMLSRCSNPCSALDVGMLNGVRAYRPLPAKTCLPMRPSNASASAHRICHVRRCTDGRTNGRRNYSPTATNLPLRLAHAHTTNGGDSAC